MSRGDPRGKRRPTRRGPSGGPRRHGSLGLRRLDERTFELVHPRCVEERREDYEEGLEIWKAGEPREARDALRYALEGCGDNLWVHVALGRIALRDANDASLARGHFGYAVELVKSALPAGFAGSLPRDRPANRPFYEALEGLIDCCERLGRGSEAAELRVLERILEGRLEAD